MKCRVKQIQMISNEKRMRADGDQNRKALLKAASKIFNTQGFDVPLSVIAKAAGVTRTTLYRNFPDRQALGMAIFEDVFQEMELLSIRLSDDENGLFKILGVFLNYFIESIGLTDALKKQAGSKKNMDALQARFVALIEPCLIKAKSANLLHKYIVPSDTALIIQMIVSSIDNKDDYQQKSQTARRALEIILSGIITGKTIE